MTQTSRKFFIIAKDDTWTVHELTGEGAPAVSKPCSTLEAALEAMLRLEDSVRIKPVRRSM